MDKNVARILRYALEQLVIVERLKSASSDVTKGTGRAVASIHNALWLLETDQVKGPVFRNPLLPHPVQWGELADDTVINAVEEISKREIDPAATPTQDDPPGGWTTEAIEAAKFPGPDKQAAQIAIAAKPLRFLPVIDDDGEEILEAVVLGSIFQIKKNSPARFRYGTFLQMAGNNVPWHEVPTFSEGIHHCNTAFRKMLSEHVEIVEQKPYPELPDTVLRWVAIGRNAEAVIANGFDFERKDIDRVDDNPFYLQDAKDAVKRCVEESCPK